MLPFLRSRQAVPAASNANPLQEAGIAAPGAMVPYARGDHVHPRLTSATIPGVTDGTGHKSVIFTRTFPEASGAPIPVFQLIEAADNGPVSFKVESWLKADGSAWSAGNAYGGCVVMGYRMRALPVLSPLTIVTFVLTGVNALFALLSGYAPYSPASGVSFSCLAIQPSG